MRLFLILAALWNAQDPGRKPIADPHAHVVPVHQLPWQTDLAPDVRIAPLITPPLESRDSVLSPNGQWLAFVFTAPDESGGRVGFQNIRTGKRYQIEGLPLPYRPITGLCWIDTLLIFDRWSQPHYGIHYIVDVRGARLLLATPFPDEFFLQQQRDSVH